MVPVSICGPFDNIYAYIINLCYLWLNWSETKTHQFNVGWSVGTLDTGRNLGVISYWRSCLVNGIFQAEKEKRHGTFSGRWVRGTSFTSRTPLKVTLLVSAVQMAYGLGQFKARISQMKVKFVHLKSFKI